MDYVRLNRAQAGAETDSFTPQRYVQFASHMGEEPATVLDVGCSTGRGGEVLKSVRPELDLWAMDCIQERLDQLDSSTYTRVVCAPAMSLPLEDQCLDFIVAGEFIEHLTLQDVLITVAEFHRVLKPGGQLLLTTPNPRYVRLLLDGRSVMGGAHLSEWTPELLTALLASAGLRRTFIEGTGRVSNVLGRRLPDWIYGSFMMGATRD